VISRQRSIFAFLLSILILLCFGTPAALATEDAPYIFREMPVAAGAGDQINPVLENSTVVFLDASGSVNVIKKININGEAAESLFTGVTAGPALDNGAVLWQNAAGDACLASAQSGAEMRCMPLASAVDMSLSAEMGVTSHSDAVIRLLNFQTMRSRILDSSTSAGGRYDPFVSGDTATWIKERGYAGKYYEPLVISYDLLTDTATYMTKMGGGGTADGQSIYERRNPVITDSGIFYQQRLRQNGSWDIYRAVVDTFGAELVGAPGDQQNLSASGRFIVYEDNRGAGGSSGTWDIYMKDLDTGIEMPVTVSPGEQINPFIDGNTIVWQDSRNGDWDIYGATIAPAANPSLALSVSAIFWQDYSEYLARKLTVRYKVRNSGPGSANQVTFREITFAPSSVMLSGSLPAPYGALQTGQYFTAELKFQVPLAVTGFRTRIRMSCTDAAGNERWFPAPPVS
jgi:beta propeller repeat protein